MYTTRYQVIHYHLLPELPGVYQFYNKANKLIYVGKAKNLKKRVGSYFSHQKSHLIKTRKMVQQIHMIGFVIVNSEYEALILENNLIKTHQPRYNVLLKDGKTFPYLCVTKGPFPRVIATRQRKPPLGIYFGPFTSTRTMEQVQELIRELYPLRSCNYHLSQENIQKGAFKVCLEYHIGNCLGPCAGLQDEPAYRKDITQVIHLLKGNFQAVKKDLKIAMLAAAKAKQFSQAQAYKEKLAALQRYQARSLIVHPTLGDFDVIAILSKDQHAFISYLYVKKGTVVFAQTIIAEKKLEETAEDILSIALLHFREKSQSEARTVLSNQSVATLPENVHVVIPKLGDKHKLVALALKNAFFFQKEHLNKKQKTSQNYLVTLCMLQQALHLKEVPQHIECFDNSNLQGTNPVAGMVCFKNGRPSKRNYRHFHIKTVVGPDDFASMKEIVKRRYQHLLAIQAPLPQLIVIDGGKGQLGAALKALKSLQIADQVEVIAIAKKLELIYLPDDPHPVYIDKKSPALKLLQRIRNAAHDFALAFHQNRRLDHALRSRLEAIPGIGPKTTALLLQTFGSVEQLTKIPEAVLIPHIGKKKSALLKKYL